MSLAGGTSKHHGCWAPLRTQVAQDFLRECEEHYHVEVGIGRDPVPGEKVLFSLGLEEDAWLLFYTHDKEKYFSWTMKLAARRNEQDDSV